MTSLESYTSPRPSKRRRTAGALLTPEDSPTRTATIEEHELATKDRILNRAANIVSVEAAALQNVSEIYATNAVARASLVRAVDAILSAQRLSRKLVVSGVGKSGYIAQKLVATLKSLGVAAAFMHACEAAHGDLGDIRADDVVLFVTFSGKTPELLNLMPHLPRAVRVVAMTAHFRNEDCALLADRPDGILIPTPIHEKEEESFGVCAPTTSTTVALAVADMLALTVAEELHRGQTTCKEVFKRYHPGGAIGMHAQEVKQLKKEKIDISVVELPSPTISAEDGD